MSTDASKFIHPQPLFGSSSTYVWSAREASALRFTSSQQPYATSFASPSCASDCADGRVSAHPPKYRLHDGKVARLQLMSP